MLPGGDLDVAQATLVPFALLVEAVVRARLEVGEYQRITASMDDDRRLAMQPSGGLDLARPVPHADVVGPRLATAQAFTRLQRTEAERAVEIQIAQPGRAGEGEILKDRSSLRPIGDEADAASRRNARAVGEEPLRHGLRYRRRLQCRTDRRETHAANVVLDRKAAIRVGISDLQRTPEAEPLVRRDTPVLRGGIAVRPDYRQRGGGLRGDVIA